MKTGFWKEVGEDGTIYSFGVYKKGVPIGVWQINYPDGLIRKTTTFDTSGYIIDWARYGGKYKLVEICSKNIPADLYMLLNYYEEAVFNAEISATHSNIIHTSDEDQKIHQFDYSYFKNNNTTAYTSYTFYENQPPDLFIVFHPYIDLLKKFQGDYKIKYFYPGGLLKDEYYISNGREAARVHYIYKLKKLKKKYIYSGGRLKLILCYNSKGEKIKEKRMD